MSHNLLIVLSFPEDGPDEPDADITADIVVDLLNRERRRNADEAGRPEYYKPVRIMGIPSPQWLGGRGLKMLMDAIHILRYAQEAAAAEVEG